MAPFRLAIEGCGHGTLHAIYASVERSCKEKGWPGIDLLIICGDFQAVRNAYDLNCVAMPAKYREMCDFHEYYSGARKAPYLTIFIGGNHEASNYLFELYYGGWVAENIYYMGAANVLHCGPIRIAGMSGIWKGYNYNKLHHERLPYNEDHLKSIYHVRDLDVRKLLQVTGNIDVGLSHDWPKGVEWMGDWQSLFRKKDHLEPDAREHKLGNTAAKNVLDKLKPRWWFSGHLHCKYAAIVEHGKSVVNGAPSTEQLVDTSAPVYVNANEIDLDLDDEDEPAPAIVSAVTNGHGTKPKDDDETTEKAAEPYAQLQSDGDTQDAKGSATYFLALDKCLPGRDFLQLLELPVEQDITRPCQLMYDQEWLAITRAFAKNEPLVLGDAKFNAPRMRSEEVYRGWIEDEREFVTKLGKSAMLVPTSFTQTAEPYDGGNFRDRKYTQAAGGLKEYTNPQTVAYCKLLDIPCPFDMSEEERYSRMTQGPRPSEERFHQNGGGRGGRGGRSYHGQKRGGWRGGKS